MIIYEWPLITELIPAVPHFQNRENEDKLCSEKHKRTDKREMKKNNSHSDSYTILHWFENFPFINQSVKYLIVINFQTKHSEYCQLKEHRKNIHFLNSHMTEIIAIQATINSSNDTNSCSQKSGKKEG